MKELKIVVAWVRGEAKPACPKCMKIYNDPISALKCCGEYVAPENYKARTKLIEGMKQIEMERSKQNV